jgi:hypothetical protein
MRDGTFALLAQRDGSRVLVQTFKTGTDRLLIEPLDAFATDWISVSSSSQRAT